MYKIEGQEDGGKAPNGPNFKLIVILFGVAILVCFVAALLFAGDGGRQIHAVHPDRHPTSQLAEQPSWQLS
jgi:hypothetical protein